jgi:3-(3-hydroxy-phenyl)propionate hydroxylase
MAKSSDLPVLVAGGGPVGIITALALARRGIPVKVFEAADSVNDSPRASTLHPASLEMLADLDLLDEIVARGLVARKFQFWDRPSHQIIAEFDHDILKSDTNYPFVVQCEQHKIANIGIARLGGFPHAELHMKSSVLSVDDRGDRVVIAVQTEQGVETHEGCYLVGADGGRSTVRKALGVQFEGYTFPERFVVLTTLFDFAAEFGAAFRCYFSDPDEWINLFKVAGDDGRGRWRVVFPSVPGQTDEEVTNDAAAEARLQKFFPKSGAYEIVHKNIYNVHQRVASSFSKGRVFLAGDSAHVNNPIGGLGLNCGVHDGFYLAGLLTGVLQGNQSPDDLARYDAVRRPINVEYVQQQTISNKKRLEEKDEAARAASSAALRATAADPAAQRAFLMRSSLLESVRR